MSYDWNPNDPDATRVHYDLSEWTFDQQAELASDMADAEIPHAWDGSELLVPEEFEIATDSAIAIVEERLGITDEAGAIESGEEDPDPIGLADDVITTEYGLDEWTAEERATVGTMLVNQHIPFRWDEHVLLVATEHEESVEGILNAVENGDVEMEPVIELSEGDDEEGPDAPVAQLPFETLTTFFLAGERLKRNPLDADGLEQLLKALDVAEPSNPPYGVERKLWERTCGLADELAAALVDDEEPDEEEAVEIATELHDLLRQYV